MLISLGYCAKLGKVQIPGKPILVMRGGDERCSYLRRNSLTSSKGSMLVNDGRLYESLLDNTEQLEILIQDLKEFAAEYRAKGIKVKL